MSIVNSSLIYIKQDGKYLMLHRVKKQGDLNKDKWLGVGGKLEFGESPNECALREAYEETGLVLDDCRYRGIVTFVYGEETEYMHLFTSEKFHGNIKECDEGVLEWVNIKDVYNLPIWEGDKEFLKLIENDEQPFFSLKLVYDENNALAESTWY